MPETGLVRVGIFSLASLCWAIIAPLNAGETTIGSHTFTLPDGFEIELVAGPPLIDRPITAAFDEQGRLYVADSSGSNDPVKKQIEDRPHRILRLEDADGDGKFETSTVFADKMMFPEGTMFHDGSLYVAAPPTIWKLTDTNGDGVADERVEWFDGKTLTGCANDLHGPYLGPDGYIYWCKGAFAEQSYTIHGKPWKTKAAHIFRCKPDGSDFDVVMTGGMDNPVDVVFLPEGERIFSTTFLVFPGNGQRDGLLHAVYGGVYGKDWGALEGHPRTGDVMPVMTHLGPAAPCGLACYESPAFGPEFYGNLFACQFNTQKVSRHVLSPKGATYESADTDFVVSNNHDFHPTDVIEDADGSLLIVDTGGWYKLCCPTSQLHKPDILGGIYRVKKSGANPIDDPRGLTIDWKSPALETLWNLLADARPAVRQRAKEAFVSRRSTPEIKNFFIELNKRQDPAAQIFNQGMPAELAALWASSQIGIPESEEFFSHMAFWHPLSQVRQAALNAISLHRGSTVAAAADSQTRTASITPTNKYTVIRSLKTGSFGENRLAAEIMGRVGSPAEVPLLLEAADQTNDRFLEHSIIYALIEIGDPQLTAAEIETSRAPGRRAALFALDQMPGGGLQPNQVIPLLASPEELDRDTANWLLKRHPDWGDALAGWFTQQLNQGPRDEAALSESDATRLESQLLTFTGTASIQQLLASVAADQNQAPAARKVALRVMARSRLAELPVLWAETLSKLLKSGDTLVPDAVAATRSLPPTKEPSAELSAALASVGANAKDSAETRLNALAAIPAGLTSIPPDQFDMILAGLAVDNSLNLRSASADILAKSTLNEEQLLRLCEALKSIGPLELDRVLGAFAHSTSQQVGLQLLAALEQAASLPSLRLDSLRQRLEKYSPEVQQKINHIESLVNVDAGTQRARIEEILAQIKSGDVRRGQAVFNNTKSACIVCHRFGYVGGNTGPDLTRIGKIRQERDLLESILYPSLSFVRSYEPVIIATVDGKVVNGLVRNETAEEITLATGPNKEERVKRADIEEIRPSTVSIMPAGLDKQLSAQDLIDLVAFLKNAQ